MLHRPPNPFPKSEITGAWFSSARIFFMCSWSDLSAPMKFLSAAQSIIPFVFMKAKDESLGSYIGDNSSSFLLQASVSQLAMLLNLEIIVTSLFRFSISDSNIEEILSATRSWLCPPSLIAFAVMEFWIKFIAAKFSARTPTTTKTIIAVMPMLFFALFFIDRCHLFSIYGFRKPQYISVVSGYPDTV